MSEHWFVEKTRQAVHGSERFEFHFGGDVYILSLEKGEKMAREILELLGIDVVQKEPLPFEPLPDPPEPSVAIRGQREVDRVDLDEETKLRNRLGSLLEQTANALKGEPDPLHLHDWSDLPEVAKQLKAENERLRGLLKEVTWLEDDPDAPECDLANRIKQALGGEG